MASEKACRCAIILVVEKSWCNEVSSLSIQHFVKHKHTGIDGLLFLTSPEIACIPELPGPPEEEESDEATCAQQTLSHYIFMAFISLSYMLNYR